MLLGFSGQEASKPSKPDPLAVRRNSENYYPHWTKIHVYMGLYIYISMYAWLSMQAWDLKIIFQGF